MNVIGISKALSYLVKGAEVIGAVGTIYDLLNAPRKSVEELKYVEQKVEKEVEYFMEKKIDKKIDDALAKKLPPIFEEHDKIFVSEFSKQIKALMNTDEMKKRVNDIKAEKAKEGVKDGAKST